MHKYFPFFVSPDFTYKFQPDIELKIKCRFTNDDGDQVYFEIMDLPGDVALMIENWPAVLQCIDVACKRQLNESLRPFESNVSISEMFYSKTA